MGYKFTVHLNQFNSILEIHNDEKDQKIRPINLTVREMQELGNRLVEGAAIIMTEIDRQQREDNEED
jgi:hypothetical protein